MSNVMPSEGGASRLPDPEKSAMPEGESGASQRRFLGIPAWATAVIFAALAALMYLLMLTLI